MVVNLQPPVPKIEEADMQALDEEWKAVVTLETPQ